MPDLRIPKIQDFIQQLINEHKIALDALLAELSAKVVLEQSDYL